MTITNCSAKEEQAKATIVRVGNNAICAVLQKKEARDGWCTVGRFIGLSCTSDDWSRDTGLGLQIRETASKLQKMIKLIGSPVVSTVH